LQEDRSAASSATPGTPVLSAEVRGAFFAAAATGEHATTDPNVAKSADLQCTAPGSSTARITDRVASDLPNAAATTATTTPGSERLQGIRSLHGSRHPAGRSSTSSARATTATEARAAAAAIVVIPFVLTAAAASGATTAHSITPWATKCATRARLDPHPRQIQNAGNLHISGRKDGEGQVPTHP
jgi:hypothetical protein